ncbi:MAG: M23 family metallopeptidase [Pseudomonadota bacterium]
MNQEAEFLGELAPLHVSKHVKRPEKRQISKRWLVSSVLVGTTSLLMMGGALFAALDGRQQLTVPAEAYLETRKANNFAKAVKGNHPGLLAKAQSGEKSNIMMVSTISKVGDKNVVKVRPFMNIKAPMALAPKPDTEYPSFNPLNIFSESGKLELVAKSSDFMYGADVEGEVTLNVVDFPYGDEVQQIPPQRRSAEILHQIHSIASNLESGGAYVSALSYFDNDRFSVNGSLLLSSGDVTITAENVSILEKQKQELLSGIDYVERTIEVRTEAAIEVILETEGLASSEIKEIADVLRADIGSESLREGDTLHAWFRHTYADDGTKLKNLVKVSLYRGPAHLISVARTDSNNLVYAPRPETPETILGDLNQAPVIPNQNLPSTYAGIYRAALNEGLTTELAGQLVKIFAFDVDFRSRISPQDRLEVFVSLEEGQENPTEASEILYAGIQLGDVMRRYYRFRDEETGRIDYYDENGKSAKKFLLRQPVPNGRFTSGFGMRRHPISRVYKLHGGVDWAAPRGTPILAAGNGVIQKAGWSSSGYGKQTILRHANGYETSYSHQTAIAKGIRPGVRVRQGQLIGYVGSTGYSTGPHLHYEVKVNGNRVDPMRIRLPQGKVLKDTELAAFEAERDRINALVTGEEELLETQVASN